MEIYSEIKCPYCGHSGMPIHERRMSQTGWIVFVVLLVVCFPLCWIPFVSSSLQEDVHKCIRCGNRIG